MLRAVAVASARQRVLVAARAASTSASATASADGPIGIVMMNMGGPGSLEGEQDGVKPFLQRLFSDGEIIRLGPLQKILGPYIAERRTPRIIEQYRAIGGKSPIGDWTALQGAEMVRKLTAMHAPAQGSSGSSSSSSGSAGSASSAAVAAPTFKHYVCFRYAPPLTEEVLLRMRADGVKRAVAFTQYPQYSCTTTGSSLNHLWRESIRLGLEREFTWSVIDRWPVHPTFVRAVARCVATGLARFPAEERGRIPILFSAHSVPMMTVNKGDPYVAEVAATVSAVMEVLRSDTGIDAQAAAPSNSSSGSSGSAAGGGGGERVARVRSPHILTWQSKVGFLPWMGPQTGEVLKGLGAQGHKRVLVVPIAFTSDHIETLFEIDKEYAHVAAEAGITQFERAPSLNGEPLLSQAQAEIVAEHLRSGAACSPQYPLNCAQCTNPACRSMLNPVAPYTKHRDSYPADAAGAKAVPRWPSDADVAALKARKEPCN